MTGREKKIIVITVIFLGLIAFAWHSLFLLSLARKTAPAPVPAASAEAALGTSSPIVSAPEGAPLKILTDEEIQARIVERLQRRSALDALMAARQKKADMVIALAKENKSSSVSSEQGEETKPKLPTDEEKARAKELLDGVQSHHYFAH